MIELIGLDADDTLWHNETLYAETIKAFSSMFSGYHDPAWIECKLEETEMRNIHTYGFGIKSFTLSMIETAIEITHGQVEAVEVEQIIEYSKHMLRADVQLLERVEETLAELSQTHNLMLITKGDTFEQERKVIRSGIADYFNCIEIVGEKTPRVYQSLLGKYDVDPAAFIMVGNSLKSDILPVLDIGGWAVYIHYEDTWAHENEVEISQDAKKYFEIDHINKLPALISGIDSP